MPVSVNGKVITSEAAAVSGAPIVDALACTITLGEQEFPGRIPLHIRRGLLIAAGASAFGDDWDSTCVLAAAVGLFWRGPPLGVGDWRKVHKRDTIDYGEEVEDALHRLYGATPEQIAEEGHRLFMICVGLVPTRQEVDEEREDFTEPPLDDSGGAAEETPAD